MIRSLYTSATGMVAQQLNMDVIANNLANVNTAGFKKSRVDFQDLLYQVTRAAGTATGQGQQVPTGVQVGLGTRSAAVTRLFNQGDFRQTDNPLDLVIEGSGFFQVQMPDGTIGYSRDGSFKLDSQGRVVTADGYPLEPEITVPQDGSDLTIAPDGTVSVVLPGQTQPQQVGQIQIARFINAAGLSGIGRNLFRPTAASGEPQVGTPGQEGFGTLAQHFVEMSNVKVVEEMVDMIVAQRAYEINSRSIQTSDEMLSIANNMRR
ncbi:MAG: flagellar basal-body rod protein FlgG [Armatimonadetes bacterium]|nr:flagellar basal-body rod protein FlgG [Armatimonadota bacterium]